MRGSIAIYSTLISWLVSQVQNIFHDDMAFINLLTKLSYFEFHYFMTKRLSFEF